MSAVEAIFSYGSPSDRRLRLSTELRELALFTAWVGVTFVQFRYDELLLYPLAFYFAFAAVRDRALIAPLVARGWIVFAFPFWCLISPMWAVDPFTALKLALYTVLTIVICFIVAARLAPKQVMLAVLLATGAAAALSVAVGITSGDLRSGIFAQKNAMGISMVVLWNAATVVLLDRTWSRPLRAFATLLAGVAALLIVASESATAQLLALGTLCINVFGATFLLNGFLRLGRLSAVLLLTGASVGALGAVLATPTANPVDVVLDAFGKDRTLTGRTALWDYAEREIEERPLLGVGGGGFWRAWESPLVRRILEENYKGYNDYFSFHNSYYEIAVHQGLVGLGLAIMAMIWAFGWIVRGALAGGSMPRVFFLSQSMAVLVNTTTESEFFKPFVLFHMLFWIGALLAVRAAGEARAAERAGRPLMAGARRPLIS